ncbi:MULTISPECIES: STAS domain-containing protein [Nocardiaceae]|uniref:Anti-sigma factor antagonist n=1 Tax=Williamsia limnetica TaxID=882452 RepID=A0A318RCR9_WILLI|nr:STAS domain-containing protein [Williamsia limnetica]PYE11121.1 anti-anti-sigma factor [Williamsia limnetica]
MHSEDDPDALVIEHTGLRAGSAALTVITVRREELVILTVEGSIDVLSAPQLSEAITDALTGRPRGLIIDLTSTDFLASAGMSALLTARDAIAPTGQFAVVADGPATSRPIRLVGLDDTLTLYPTLDNAIAALS